MYKYFVFLEICFLEVKENNICNSVNKDAIVGTLITLYKNEKSVQILSKIIWNMISVLNNNNLALFV